MVLLLMMMIVVGAVGVKVIVKRSKMSSGRNKGCEYNNKNTKSSGDKTKRRKRALLAKNSFCRFSLSLSSSSSSSSSSRSFYYGL
jgi:hypothetical protein